MQIIPTLGTLKKRTTFAYDGNVNAGVVLHFPTVRARVTAEFFTAILDEFQGRRMPGGFSMTNPTPGGLGEWVEAHSAKLNAVRLSPRHASFIAAILVSEGFITGSLEGNAVYLQF